LSGSRTVATRILERARAAPGEVLLTVGGAAVTGARLAGAVEGFAGALEAEGLARGERVLVALPNGLDFLVAFLGIQLAGGAPVPLAAGSGPGRLAAFGGRCGATRVVVAAAEVEPLRAALAHGGDGAVLAPFSVASRVAGARERREPSPAELAFLQYTSGSTGEPKGVAVRHGQLLLNIAQMVSGFAIGSGDVFVTWLPMHHDMGLVLMTLTPLVVGATLHVEESGLGAIRGWTAALARHRATFTAAPDFGYRLALRLRRPGSAVPDLSSLRVALDAAEPVRAATVEEFTATYRLRPGVVLPGYGLAEATVGVTAPVPGTALRADARGAVALGRGFPGVRLRVAGERGEALAAGEVGEVWVASPARAAGYFADPEASAETFRDDGWLRTGDLGYLDASGALFVVGRRKDLLSWGGSTVAPREIEELVDQLPFTRRSAAVGVELDGRTEGELPFLFVEVSARGVAHEELARQVVTRVRHHLGIGPARVCLVRPGTLPLTANGKLRRRELAERYRSGALAAEGRLLFPVP
jgi:acyl-CoA synthetase (AMP-forming)/AMP-acid ligase II